VRSARQEANKEVKALGVSEDLEKNAEIDIQELTDTYIKKVDQVLEVKEAEIMKV
jgi:ribosome recycling factor